MMALAGNKADLSEKRKVEAEVRTTGDRDSPCPPPPPAQTPLRTPSSSYPLPQSDLSLSRLAGGAELRGGERAFLHGDVCQDSWERQW